MIKAPNLSSELSHPCSFLYFLLLLSFVPAKPTATLSCWETVKYSRDPCTVEAFPHTEHPRCSWPEGIFFLPQEDIRNTRYAAHSLLLFPGHSERMGFDQGRAQGLTLSFWVRLVPVQSPGMPSNTSSAEENASEHVSIVGIFSPLFIKSELTRAKANKDLNLLVK